VSDEPGRRVTFTVEPEQAGQRLDRVVAAALPDLSRAHVQRLIEESRITVDALPVKPSHKPRPGQVVSVTVPAPAPVDLRPEPLPLHVCYEDAAVLVIDKPAGLVVHPAPGHPAGTLVNAVLAHAPEVATNGTQRPGIVHRLDKDTSGLMVVAKNDAARAALVAQFAGRAVLKEYLALVQGYPPAEAVIEAPIGRDPRHRQRMAVVPDGRPARTEITAVETLPGYTLVRARLHTGRTHQIRVHLAWRGHPIAGDVTYGSGALLQRAGRGGALQRRALGRQFLHAARLGFRLPPGGEWREFTSPLPADLAAALDWLRGRAD
jgi:23S rRNA pseudouridine1911/1915/1917 synthase